VNYFVRTLYFIILLQNVDRIKITKVLINTTIMDPNWWIQNGFGEVKIRILNSEPINLIKLSTTKYEPIYSR